MNDDNLATYINDHIAGSVAGIELTRHCLEKNRGTELGAFLERMLTTLEREQERLKRIIRLLGAWESPAKKLAAWTVGRASLVKFDNVLAAYSPLNRLEELETLLVAVQGQARMWAVVRAYRSADPRFAGLDFDEAFREAECLREELEHHHLQAAGEALGAGEAGPTS